MIQELFGGNAAKVLEPSSSPSPSSSTTTHKLRCPRCDSSHTKFCYYNNYNLTQPRHFCKTCRRYWTKGGALRNVPIGGGCRKNKSTTITTSTGKLKATISTELCKSSFLNGLELESSSNPILWSPPPQTSHLLSLFRATQNPNPNFQPSSLTTHMKDQSFMIGSNMGSLGLGFEPLGQTQTSSLGLCSSLWRNDHTQQDHQNHHDQQHDDLQQGFSRLRSSSLSSANSYYNHDQSAPLILGGNVANNTSSSTILDNVPVLASGELGFWNQTVPWSDLAATNGAYP
ncbi:hypothetical protein QVD17_24834 [Tagetes erecta]|uniref:Dof zinc finger protein n=1 Tax=Tagetes erecta TaxID=13708 RepID=A0AAD8KJ05_TARER|nr:hypothetical protein QVD17_24834 [Tagetes erecta]